MTHKNTETQAYINDLVKKHGTVTYNTKGMYAPEHYTSGQSLFVSEQEFAQARRLAQQKLEYLISTARSSETGDPDSFSDLRDGGTDTAGEGVGLQQAANSALGVLKALNLDISS